MTNNKRFDYVEEAYQRIDWLNKQLGKTMFKIEQYAKDNYAIVFAQDIQSKADSYTFRKGVKAIGGYLTGKELFATAGAMYALARLQNRLSMTPEQFREVDA